MPLDDPAPTEGPAEPAEKDMRTALSSVGLNAYVSMPARNLEPTAVIGATGLLQYAGFIEEEWLSPLRGLRGVRVYREMNDNDGTIGSSFAIIRAIVRQTKWTVQAAKDSGAKGDEQKEYVEQCMEDMEHTWTDLVSEILSFLPFGWSCFEKVYKTREGIEQKNPTKQSHYDDGKIGWRKIAIRAQETLYRWVIEQDGNVLGWVQIAAPTFEPTFLPMEKMILFRFDTNKNNPEGRSMLRAAYRSWFFLKRMQEIEAVGIERDLVGLPVLELPTEYFMQNASVEKKTQLAAFAKLLQQVRRNEHEGITMPSELKADGTPSGYRLRLLSTGGARQIDPSKTIERYEKRIAQSLFTQFMFLGMDGSGSLALSSDITDVFTVAVSTILDIIEDTFHRFGTAELMKLNGVPPELWPRITHGQVSKRNMDVFAKALLSLVGAGVLTPDSKLEDYVRSEAGLPERDTEDEQGDDDDEASANARRMAQARGGNPLTQPAEGTPAPKPGTSAPKPGISGESQPGAQQGQG